MPDIGMCRDISCPSRNECYRFRAVPNPYRQGYGGYKHNEELGRCINFIQTMHYDRLTEVDCINIKREGESCSKNNNCTYPKCKTRHDK